MWRVLWLSLMLWFVISCVPSDPPVGPILEPAIHTELTPEFLLCNVESLYTFSVRIENLDDLDSVYCSIRRPDGTEQPTMRMFDDGSAHTLFWPDYASINSGDIVPNNGTFTRGVYGNLLCALEEGVYEFTFHAVSSSQTLETEAVDVEIRAPLACSIVSAEHPTLFPGCFEPTMLNLELNEDPEIAVDAVKAQWISGDTLWWEEQMTRIGETSTWQLEALPRLFGCTPSGTNYTLRYEAYNAFGLSCFGDYGNIAFENELPVLSNPQLPDTMYRPLIPSERDTLQFFVRSDDCEIVGMANTFAVRFEISRDDTEHFRGDSDFYLRDDGISPDETMGDGLASSFLVVDTSTVHLNNVYYLRFFSIECSSGDTTDYLLDSTRIIHPGSIFGGGKYKDSFDLGLSCFK